MIKKIQYSCLFFILCICVSCKHEYFSMEEVKYWMTWCESDTVYFTDAFNNDIDTLIIRNTLISLPPTRNVFDSYGNSINIGHDMSSATINFDLYHEGHKYRFQIVMWGYDKYYHHFSVELGRSYSSINNIFPFNEQNNYVVLCDGKGFDVPKDKPPFDYFMLHRDSTLLEYSIDSVRYKQLH